MKRHIDCIGAAAFMAVGLTFFLLASQFRDVNTFQSFGPAFFPQIVSAAIIILGACLMLQALRGEKSGQDGSGEERKTYWAVGASAAALFLYLSLMKTLGFVIASALYLFAQINLFAWRNPSRKPFLYAIISVCASLLLYAFFRYVMLLSLPSGILPF